MGYPENPQMGITPIMEWVQAHYGKEYAANTRETFRRQSMHQFRDAGMVLCNPDQGDRPVNSPNTVYRIEPATLVARYAKEPMLVHVDDTGCKWRYCDTSLLATLGINVDSHGKMPDVVLHYVRKNWLLLVEAVTSHGPVDGKRHAELAGLFAESTAGLVYVTAFPNRATMGQHLREIAWETEVWVADAPSHLIHFNGVHFLGPHPNG